MEVVFETSDLDRLERDPSCDLAQPREVVTAFRKRLQGLRSAASARDLFALASWHATILQGPGPSCVALPLTSRARLLVHLDETAETAEHVRIVGIEEAV